MIFQWKYQVQKIGVDDMSLFIVISLFITSFLPLWISIIFIDVKSLICNGSNVYTEIVSIIVIVIANFFSLISLCNWMKREPVTSEELKISYAYENKTVSSDYQGIYTFTVTKIVVFKKLRKGSGCPVDIRLEPTGAKRRP